MSRQKCATYACALRCVFLCMLLCALQYASPKVCMCVAVCVSVCVAVRVAVRVACCSISCKIRAVCAGVLLAKERSREKERDGPCRSTYGVATISRLLKVSGLFCKKALSKRRYSATNTYNFKEPTKRSHPIVQVSQRVVGTQHTVTHCNTLQHTATPFNAPWRRS